MNVSGSNHTSQDVFRDCFNQSSPSNGSEVLFYVDDVIRQVAPPLFLSVGLLGNILTMAVLMRQGMTNTFTGVSLFVVAVMDIMSLLAYYLPDWLGAVAEQDFRNSSSTTCQVFMFFTYISCIVSPWALVAITMERVTCLVWPFKAKKIFTAKISLCVHAILLPCAIAISSYTFEIFEVSEIASNVFGSACRTIAHLDETDLATITLNYISSGMAFQVPFVLLIAGNSAILQRLSVRRNFSLQRGDATTTKRYRNLSILVSALNMTVLFSQFPMSIYVLFEARFLDWTFSSSCTDQFWYRLGVFRLTWTACSIMALISPSTNFLLYFVSSAEFRKEIRAFVKCEKAGKRTLFNN